MLDPAGPTRPDQAVAVLQRGLVEQAPSQRRDKGLLLARLATADASIGEVESACAAGGQAVRIASSTGSARTTRELLQLRHRQKPWKRREMVSGLSQEIGSLAGRAT
jgi:hypothetical protein